MNLSDYTQAHGSVWHNYPPTVLRSKEYNGRNLSLSIVNYVQDGVLHCNFTVQYGENVIRNTNNYAVALFYYEEYETL